MRGFVRERSVWEFGENVVIMTEYGVLCVKRGFVGQKSQDFLVDRLAGTLDRAKTRHWAFNCVK